ncbi:MAG: hypothetical protein ACP5N2_05075 [Candidatus Nanoarchaeia archaeon]
MKNIKTGVDRLVEIIGTAKRISLDDASKQLGISQQVVQEWADFLEKEKLITIEYSFSKVWLCEKRLSKSEIASTAKELSSEKDAFSRKIDSAIKSLEKDTAGFEEIKTQFVKIQSTVKDKISIVEQELLELEKYTSLKQNLDKIIEKQKEEYEKQIGEIVSKVQKTKTEHDSITENIAKELKALSTEHEKVITIQRAQTELINTVNSAKVSIAHLEKEIAQEQNSITTRLKKIDELKAQADALHKRISGDKESPIAPIIHKISEDHKLMIQKQDELILNAKAKTKELQDYSSLIEQIRGSFKGFFSKKIKTEQMIMKIEAEKIDLEKSLRNLDQKIKGLEIMNSSKELRPQVEEIGKELKNYEQNRSELMKKIDDLLAFIKA